jgi:hypothetical protein
MHVIVRPAPMQRIDLADDAGVRQNADHVAGDRIQR